MDTALILIIAVILVLLLLSAFFSGSETALTAASRARMHQLERKGNQRARLVGRLSEQKERLIGAILLGNNLVNILASALATSVLIGLFGTTGVAYATVAMTLLIVIFAELLPKTYAIGHADRMALAVAPAIRPIVRLLAPLTRVLQLMIGWTLKLIGLDPSARGSIVSSAEEIRGTVELHRRAGGLRRHQGDMIDGILDLSDVAISEVMVHRRNMFMIDADQPAPAVFEKALKSPYTRVPLWRGQPENIVGILHAKDLLRALAARQGDTEGVDVTALATEPWFVPETTTLREQLDSFRRRHAHFALVVDEYGTLMGIVTLEDIIEEIVGDIADEHDIAATEVRLEPDGSCVANGEVTIRDLNRQFDWELPEEEATTIAGLILHEAEVIPEVGQRFDIAGFGCEVLRRQHNRITAVRITPAAPARDSARQ